MCTKQTRYLYNIYLFIFKLRHVASIARLTGRAQAPPHFAHAPPHFAQAPPHVFKKNVKVESERERKRENQIIK